MHAIDEHAESKVDMIHDRLFRNVASSACDHSADIMQALLVWLAQVRDAQPSRPDSSHATATFDQALPNPKFFLLAMPLDFLAATDVNPCLLQNPLPSNHGLLL